MCRGKLASGTDEDWVLTGAGPQTKEVVEYLTNVLQGK
jgi:hypothetical protein